MSNPTGQVRRLDGALWLPEGARVAIVASRFNAFVVDRLVEGALDALIRHGAPPEAVTIIRVPGSRETPTLCRRLAQSGKFDAIIAVGAVIRGETAHFDYVASEVSRGVAEVAMQTEVVVIFGVLTTDTMEQALERAGGKAGNKGFDAALAAIEMLSLSEALKKAGI
jgi:6,7-dimethyl-8-ribityllumazine synthase